MAESPFNGYWQLDLERCEVWDWEKKAWAPDQIEREDLRLTIEGDVYDWDMWVGKDPATRVSHTNVIGGGWAPYMCRDIVTSTERTQSGTDVEKGPIGLVEFEIGKPISHIKIVQVSETFIYRISKSVDGGPGYVLSTEVIDGGDGLTGYLMAPNGQVAYHRTMKRTA
jgi:hypothetical protein